jgi:hypothetical protein
MGATAGERQNVIGLPLRKDGTTAKMAPPAGLREDQFPVGGSKAAPASSLGRTSRLRANPFPTDLAQRRQPLAQSRGRLRHSWFIHALTCSAAPAV